MSRFFSRKPVLGIEITSSAVRLAALSGRGENLSVFYTKIADLPSGMVTESYTTPNIGDVISPCVANLPELPALSPDSPEPSRRGVSRPDA
jgi:Tfp pilus assembly PilM family ATPase